MYICSSCYLEHNLGGDVSLVTGWGADSRCCCEKDGISGAVIRIAMSGCSRYFPKCQPHKDLKECAKKHVACSS